MAVTGRSLWSALQVEDVADKPAGPFTFLGQRNTAEEHGWGQDLGLFKDTDGKGYLVYDDGHRDIRVDLLADDFLSTCGQTTIALKSDGKTKRYEGAALIRYKGKYVAAGSWCRPVQPGKYVTDGPCFYRLKSGPLLMLWSSFGERGYAVGVARSVNGTVLGPWTQARRPLYEGGGHCMILLWLGNRNRRWTRESSCATMIPGEFGHLHRGRA